MLVFTNSLRNKKERFEPFHDKKVSMYVCGITPYDFAHIGHGRCYVTFDLVQRLLTFLGYSVSYARNFTDIDDKIIRRAKEELGDVSRYQEIAEKYIKAFHADMKKLHCETPQYEPRVTQVIPQIITFVQGLIDKGYAYVHDGSVYFRVTRFVEYGKLSKQTIQDLQSGARIQIDDCKESPLDFALWKRDDEVGFASPWGQGRPGWHIECSAMIRDIFGETIDIHAGGMDLLFPHHENEKAQSESLYNEQFVRYWLHNAFVRINKEKMSKSLGNFFTLHEIFEQFDPMVVRFYFLKHHYRNPLDFSFDDLKASEKAYKKLTKAFAGVSEKSVHNIELVKQNFVVEEMLDCVMDDLNTSGAFGVLFEKLPILQDDEHALALVKYFITKVFGLTLEPIKEKSVKITPEIQKLINEREKARQEKNWSRADELRNQLQELGVDLQDKKLQ